MIKLLVSTPTDFDSSSFYRCWGVLHNLNRKMGGTLHLHNFKAAKYTWAELAGFDILFIHRPYSPEVLQLAMYCKNIGVKIWVDYDDNLFNLPPENRAFDNFDLDIKKVMRSILEQADIITVSTEALKTFFKESLFVPNPVEVIPNALNDDFFQLATSFNTTPNYCWRGSETHHADILDYTNEIFEAMQANAHPWYFIGYRPHLLMRNFVPPKLNYVKPVDPLIYHNNLKAIKPHVMHVPLSDNALNHSKSNIAWIEATFAGAITIAPHWPEWQRPGVLTYKDAEEYKFYLTMLPENPAQLWQQSRDYIAEHLVLSKVNELREDVIEKLLSKSN